MPKYVQTFEIVRYFKDNEEAKQSGFLQAKNERKKYDNECNFHKLHRIDGIVSTEIKIK